NLSLTVLPTLVITTSTLANGGLGVPYGASLSAGGGNGGPYTWAVISGLPSGLALNPSSGAIGGTPLQSGTYSPVFSASDGASPVATKQLQLVIHPVLQVVT